MPLCRGRSTTRTCRISRVSKKALSLFPGPFAATLRTELLGEKFEGEPRTGRTNTESSSTRCWLADRPQGGAGSRIPRSLAAPSTVTFRPTRQPPLGWGRDAYQQFVAQCGQLPASDYILHKSGPAV